MFASKNCGSDLNSVDLCENLSPILISGSVCDGSGDDQKDGIRLGEMDQDPVIITPTAHGRHAE